MAACVVKLRNGDSCRGSGLEAFGGRCLGHVRKARIAACVDVLLERGMNLDELAFSELIEKLDEDPASLTTEELGLVLGHLEGDAK